MGAVRHDGEGTAIISSNGRTSAAAAVTVAAAATDAVVATFDTNRTWRGERVVVPRYCCTDMEVALVFTPVCLVCNATHHQHAVRICLKYRQAAGDGPRSAFWPVALLDSVVLICRVAGDQLAIHRAHRKFALCFHARSTGVHRHALSKQDSTSRKVVAVWIRIAGAVMQARVAAASMDP